MNRYIEIKEENLKKIAPTNIVQEIKIIDMYMIVFKDFIECYLEGVNCDEEKITLTNDEIKEIAYKMIYKNEYVWEIINETIDTYIQNILYEREKKHE